MREGEIPNWKVEKVDEVKKLIDSKQIVGIINLENLPSAQFQEIKKHLRKYAEIQTYKANFIKRALEKAKDKNVKELEKYIDGPVAIMLTNENPFKIFKIIKQNRSKVFAKSGMKAEKDLIIPAGETDLPAGPALSELKMAKVDCKIDKGKIYINKDSVVTKKGDIVSDQAASSLSKLGIKPVEIGLTVKAIYENGVIYTPETLDINEETFMNTLQGSYLRALNLSVNAGYVTKQGMPFMIERAFTKARNLAVNAGIYTKQTIEMILTKSANQMKSLKTEIVSKGFTE